MLVLCSQEYEPCELTTVRAFIIRTVLHNAPYYACNIMDPKWASIPYENGSIFTDQLYTHSISMAGWLSVCLLQVALPGKASSVAAGANHSLALRSERMGRNFCSRLPMCTRTRHALILPRQAKDKTQILMKLNGDVGLESQRGWRYALGLGQQRAWYDSLPCFQTLDLLILLRHTLDNTTQCCCCSCLLSCRLAWVDCRAARAVGGRGRVVAAAASDPAQPG